MRAHMHTHTCHRAMHSCYIWGIVCTECLTANVTQMNVSRTHMNQQFSALNASCHWGIVCTAFLLHLTKFTHIHKTTPSPIQPNPPTLQPPSYPHILVTHTYFPTQTYGHTHTHTHTHSTSPLASSRSAYIFLIIFTRSPDEASGKNSQKSALYSIYWVATMSRLLKITGLFCSIAPLL